MTPDTKSPPRPAQKSLQHRTMAAAVAGSLRERILDGEFKAGCPLRQDALASEFGVSRIPVREALMQLEAEGLVKIHPHRGAIVSELSMEEVQELFALRALLEPRLLEASARQLTSSDYEKLNRILQEYSAELWANHIRRWGELNTEFHMLLYRHAGQPRTLAIVANLLQECDRHTRLQLSLTDGMKRAETEHAELVRLCESGQVTAACVLLRTHIEDVEEALRTYIEGHQRTDSSR